LKFGSRVKYEKILNRSDIGKGKKSRKKNHGNKKSRKVKIGNYFYRDSQNQEISKFGMVKI